MGGVRGARGAAGTWAQPARRAVRGAAPTTVTATSSHWVPRILHSHHVFEMTTALSPTATESFCSRGVAEKNRGRSGRAAAAIQIGGWSWWDAGQLSGGAHQLLQLFGLQPQGTEPQTIICSIAHCPREPFLPGCVGTAMAAFFLHLFLPCPSGWEIPSPSPHPQAAFPAGDIDPAAESRRGFRGAAGGRRGLITAITAPVTCEAPRCITPSQHAVQELCQAPSDISAGQEQARSRAHGCRSILGVALATRFGIYLLFIYLLFICHPSPSCLRAPALHGARRREAAQVSSHRFDLPRVTSRSPYGQGRAPGVPSLQHAADSWVSGEGEAICRRSLAHLCWLGSAGTWSRACRAHLQKRW